jgi:FkbM family methyltransferase
MRKLNSFLPKVVNATLITASVGNFFLGRWPFPIAHDPDFPLAVKLASNRDGGILDVGANIGQSSYFFASLLPQRSIISIEPVALSTQREAWLKRRIPNLEVVRAVCGNLDNGSTLVMWTPRVGPFKLDTASSTSLDPLKARMKVMFPWAYKLMTFRDTSVPVTTIDAMGTSPALIKIDVEGYEYPCLQGAIETIRRSQPVLLIEFTENRDQILKVLSDIK